MGEVISKILHSLGDMLKFLGQFLLVLILGVIWLIVVVLPWLLRILSLFAWLAGMYLMMLTIENLYGGFTEPVPLAVLKSIPIILGVSAVVAAFKEKSGHIWGTLLVTGLAFAAVWKFLPALIAQYPETANLVIRIAPATLSGVLLIYVTARFGPGIRARRMLKTSTPPLPDEALTGETTLTES